MPKDPVRQEKKEPEVEVLPSEEHKKAEVEIDLSPKPGEDIEKLRNQLFYEMRKENSNQEKRILERQRQMLDEYFSRLPQTTGQQVSQTPQQGSAQDEIEELAQKDWKAAVRKLAEEEAREIIKKRESEFREEQTKQAMIRQEERSRQKVLAAYPNILDEGSHEFKAYMDIFNEELREDPYFVNNPRKHEIILPQLRERLKAPEDAIERSEIERLKRVAAGAQTPSRPAQTQNKIVLSQEEIDMCKKSGIPVEVYARTKKIGPSGFKEGMVMDE